MSSNQSLDKLRAQIAAIQSNGAGVEVDRLRNSQLGRSQGEQPEDDTDRKTKKLKLRLQRRAHYMLSRRDYARQELAQKLLDRPLHKANSQKAQFKRYVEAQRAEQAQRWGDDSNEVELDETGVLAESESSLDQDLPEEPPPEQVADWVEDLLNELERDGYLSNARYCEGYIRSKYNAGQGPTKIIQRLRQNEVNSDLIIEQMQAYDWFERAREVRVQKYGQALADDYQQRAKQMRFLQSRGFDGEQCRYATE